MTLGTRSGALLVAVVALAACLDDSITGTRPLAFSMTASTQTASVGQDITFSYEATGTALQWVVVDYGDGLADTVFTSSNVVEASGTLTHAYDLTGDFLVSGKAENFTGTRTQEIDIEVQ
jgi:hypothetical protein